jgi:hypothetical protein
MTTLQRRLRTTVVRAAGLVDVPAVVRLIAPPSPSSSPSPSASPLVPDGCLEDWEQAQRAMRLMLAHHALEEGQVWVAERDDGVLLGAGIWLPPGTETEPPDTCFSSLLSRELATGPTGPTGPTGRYDRGAPAAAAALKAAGPDEPHWKVVIVGALDDTDDVYGTGVRDRTVAVAADLLAPGLRAVDDQAATAVAITVSARQRDRLRPFGFRGAREVRLTPGASVWLMTRHPKGRPGQYALQSRRMPSTSSSSS